MNTQRSFSSTQALHTSHARVRSCLLVPLAWRPHELCVSGGIMACMHHPPRSCEQPRSYVACIHHSRGLTWPHAVKSTSVFVSEACECAVARPRHFGDTGVGSPPCRVAAI